MLTRDQRYAATIFQQINEEIAPQPPGHQKKYGSMAHKLPVLIRTAGLTQALAFVDSRGSDEQKRLLDHIAAVVKEPDLVARSRKAELAEYMLLTRNVLAALVWYKRFAQSVLGVVPGEEEQESTSE